MNTQSHNFLILRRHCISRLQRHKYHKHNYDNHSDITFTGTFKASRSNEFYQN